ncbi:hypothetical protein O3P69_010793 [Scylla paramamosain]|uniref:Peptidase S1 domain-containing protein n=1 Tax=Scylla paramamosain TaxID=85552 RepID=A0AAW0TGF8_SCYPA
MSVAVAVVVVPRARVRLRCYPTSRQSLERRVTWCISSLADTSRQCPAGEDCILLSSCQPLRDLVTNRVPGWQRRVREAQCGRRFTDYRVCCPGRASPTNTTSRPGVSGENLLPSGHNCGQSLLLKILFGEDVMLNGYPWMAILGYENRANPKWQCGGVLLNDRYVLTAAHCAHRNFTVLRGLGSLVTVRLGEHVISTNPDCPQDTSLPIPCAPSPQDFTPQEVIIHRDFNRRRRLSDDIALIRLDRKATLGSAVHPLCLPPAGVDIPSFLGGRDAIVAGWGITETGNSSDILQAAKIPFVEHSVCTRTYPDQLVQEQVCFGGRGRVDSCNMDSGGPLFQVSNDPPRFVLLAILSGGLGICGTPGAPGVYTNVDSYRQWIVESLGHVACAISCGSGGCGGGGSGGVYRRFRLQVGCCCETKNTTAQHWDAPSHPPQYRNQYGNLIAPERVTSHSRSAARSLRRASQSVGGTAGALVLAKKRNKMNWRVCCSLVVVAVVAATASAGAARTARQAKQCAANVDCISLRKCRPIQDLVASREPGWQTTVRDAICGQDSDGPRVCCQDSGSNDHIFSTSKPAVDGETLLPKGTACGQSSQHRVVFGEDAPLYAFPWMVLLGYRDRSNPAWKCGGTLISDRYVLTAAHCVHRNFTVASGNGDVVAVRVGEHTISTNPDCAASSAVPCAPAPQDFDPEEVIVHTQFNKRAPVSDDIALIRLSRKVTITTSAHPVCLPPAGLDVQSFLGARDGVVAGWGATENTSSSDILQAAKIPFANKTVCEPFYRGQLVDEQVCFGGRGNVDSCFGDSGGPVFQASNDIPRFTMLGIVSRGLRECGTPGAPAVYTNVAFYTQWVTNNIKP